ncbi:hypothetical protein HO113_04280 [Corynebacterium ulcerans]|nr:hypothetical protein CULC809_00639 [Corynebacterium ulcerans 809]NOL58700.1 hypothetical protein [Corynebacterium ulcerans]NOM02172.1 hypothetical protein [Corynebacterium ulcerans]
MTTVLVYNGCVTFFFLFSGEISGSFLEKCWSKAVVMRWKFFITEAKKKAFFRNLHLIAVFIVAV